MKPEDQVAAEKAEGQSQAKEKPKTLNEYLDAGFEEMDLLEKQEAEAAAKPKEEAKAADTKKEPGDLTGKTPFKILKVGGKEIPVYSEAEYDAFAQKGIDYTKKTQALADDRRGAEAEVKKETDRLATVGAQMNDLLDKFLASGILPRQVGAAKKAEAEAAGEAAESAGKVDEEDMAVYKEFGLEPESALPHEKKIVKTLVEQRKIIEEIRAERASEIIEQAIAEERENFPFEDIKDDQGKDTTRDQLRAIMLTKKNLSGIVRPDLDTIVKWSRDAVRELHDRQKTNGGPNVTDEMEPAEFMKKFPNLAKKFKLTVAEEAAAEKDKVPPSLKTSPKPADTSKQPKVEGQRKSLGDYLDAGFADPDVIKALSGE